MTNKTSPEMKIKLHKQGAENPWETTSSSEESDSEYEDFTPKQLLHLHQTILIYPRKVLQMPNFETHPKSDTVEPKIRSVPQGISIERGSEHKTNQQDQYVDFNVSELNEETSPDQFICNRRV